MDCARHHQSSDMLLRMFDSSEEHFQPPDSGQKMPILNFHFVHGNIIVLALGQ
jgi:hypothetical protein